MVHWCATARGEKEAPEGEGLGMGKSPLPRAPGKRHIVYNRVFFFGTKKNFTSVKKKILVLLSASVEIFGVSRMWDF